MIKKWSCPGHWKFPYAETKSGNSFDTREAFLKSICVKIFEHWCSPDFVLVYVAVKLSNVKQTEEKFFMDLLHISKSLFLIIFDLHKYIPSMSDPDTFCQAVLLVSVLQLQVYSFKFSDRNLTPVCNLSLNHPSRKTKFSDFHSIFWLI